MSRLARFNTVGALGFAVQLGVLAALDHAGWPVILATLVAVEAAVLHNFIWHERWTWADVQRDGSRAGRLMRFHVTNGIISLAGNALLTTAFVRAGMPAVAANVAAVALCAAANFASAHTFVFCAKTWPIFDGHLH